MAFLNTAKLLKERIDACGMYGADYEVELMRLKVDRRVGLAIAKKLLHPSGYQFLEKATGSPVDVSLALSHHLSLTCFAPDETKRRAFGFESAEHFRLFQERKTMKDRALDPLSQPAILGKLGKSGSAGLTYQEIHAHTNTKTVSEFVDRLEAFRLVTKTVVMAAETKGPFTIVHLRKHARQFNATVHNLQQFPGEHIRDEVFRFFYRLLDAYEVETLTTPDICLIFKLNKKMLQNCRSQAQASNRANADGSIIEFEQTVSASMNRSGLNFGSFRTLWVIRRGPKPPHPHYRLPPRPQEVTYRSRNLSLFEQIDAAIFATGERGLSTTELRKLTGLSAKRASRLAEDLRKSMNYPSIRELEGKNMVYRLVSPALAIGGGDDNMQEEAEESAILSPRPAPPKVKQEKKEKKKAVKPKSSKKKRKRFDSDSEDDDSSFEASSEEEDDEYSDDDLDNEEGVRPQKQLKATSRSFQISSSSNEVQLLARSPQILEYLKSQAPHCTGCTFEVTRLLREQAGTFVDKKTVLRAVQQLEALGLIRQRLIPRGDRTVDTFGGCHGKNIIALLLVRDEDQGLDPLQVHEVDDQRIEEYFTQYKAEHQKDQKDEQKKKRRKVNSIIEIEDKDDDLEEIGSTSKRARSDKAPAKNARRKVSFQESAPTATAAEGEAVNELIPPAPAQKVPVAPMKAQRLQSEIKPALVTQQVPTTKKPRATASSSSAAVASVTLVDNELKEVEETAETKLLLKPPPPKVKATKPLPQSQSEKEKENEEPKKKKKADEPAVPIVDDWNEEQDRALLENFLISFLVQKARQGLPTILKPTTKAGSKNKATSFELPPWLSPTLDIDFGDVQPLELKQSYTSSSGIMIPGQSLANCRRRLPYLIKPLRDIRHLAVRLLWMGPEKMSSMAKMASMFVVQEGHSRLSLPSILSSSQATSELEEQTRGALQRQMIRDRLLQFCEPGTYPSFSILELIGPLLPSLNADSPLASEDGAGLREQAIAIIRELYLHHFLRREGSDETIENFEETRFFLSPAFTSAILERSFGSFLYDMLALGDADGNFALPVDTKIEEDIMSAEYKEAKSLLTIAAATEHVTTTGEIMNKVAVSADVIDENRVMQRAIDEITTMDSIQQLEIFTTNPIHESFEKRKSHDRMEAQLALDTSSLRTMSCKFAAIAQQVNGLGNQEILSLPWIDPSTGEVKMTTLRMYTVQAMSYLADHTSGTLKQIHALLFVLSFPATQALMDLLVSFNLVREKQPEVTVKLSNAFAAMDFWTTRNAGNQQVAEVIYELVA